MEEKQDKQKAQLFKESRAEERKFRAMLPKTGFFKDYMEYTDSQESPGSFHFWTACAVISAVLKRRCWVSKGIYNVFPNIYVIVVAKSGRCRKSRALNLGSELIHDFDFVNFIADKTTPEALLESLMMGRKEDMDENDHTPDVNIQIDHTGFVHAGELAVFINKQTYTSEMVKILTHMYDCPPDFKYRTRNKRQVVLEKPSITLLGASTPEWLASSLPEEAFEGGFMSRVVFVFKKYKDRQIALPVAPPPDKEQKLKKMLLYIHKHFRGEIKLTDEAQRWFVSWYKSLDSAELSSDILEGFIERKPDNVLKVALFLSAAEDPTIKEIDKGHLIQAEQIVSETQERMFRSFENVDVTRFGKLRIKVKEMIDQAGEVPRRDIARRLGNNIQSMRDLEEVEKLMIEAGELEVSVRTSKNPEGKGRPSTYYISTNPQVSSARFKD